MSDAKDFSVGRLVLRSTMCAPAIRMVVIEAYAWADERFGERTEGCAYRVLPVVAIVSKTMANYFLARPGRHLDAASHEEAVKQGWRFEDTEDVTELIVFARYESDSPECHEASFFEASNAVLHQEICPWPAAEDPERLKPALRATLSRLRVKLEHSTRAERLPDALAAIDRMLTRVEAAGVQNEESSE